MWIPDYLRIENLASHEKTSYTFQAGRVVVVQGENHDKHSGQESNGSGKSALLEGIAIALAGVSFRKVRAAELVRNGQDSLFVGMCLRNSRASQVLEIDRIIFANTKASKVAVKLNGVPVDRLTSVDEANAYILEVLGISKEDLLNYFLISKEKFCSFFDTADSKKKQLINRFSGADRLEQLTPKLEEKLRLAQAVVDKTSVAETQARTRVDVYTEELKAAQLAKPQEKREQELAALVERSNQVEGEYKQARTDNVEALRVVQAINAELTALGTDKSQELTAILNEKSESVNQQIARLQTVVRNVEGPGSQWHIDRSAINDKREGLFAEQRTAKATLKEVQDFESDLQKTIRGSIECPKCEHQFDLADPATDVHQCVHELKELQDILLPDATAEVNRLAEAILHADTEMDQARQRMVLRRAEAELALATYRDTYETPLTKEAEAIRLGTQQYYASLREINNRLTPAQDVVSKLKRKIDGLKNDLDAINAQIEAKQNEQLEDLLGPLAAKLEKAQDQLAVAEIAHGEAKEIRDKAGAWPVRMKQFKSYLANQLLDTLSGYTNLYLDKIGSDLQIELEGYRMLADRKTIKEELTAKLLRGGEDAGSFHKYSMGERARVDFCQILAVQHLINHNSPTGGLNLIVADEILDSVDSRGVHELSRKLDNLDKNIMIVTHAGADVPFPNRILIEKRNGISTLAA